MVLVVIPRYWAPILWPQLINRVDFALVRPIKFLLSSHCTETEALKSLSELIFKCWGKNKGNLTCGWERMKLVKKGSIIGQVVGIGLLLLWVLKDSTSPSICSEGNEHESEASGMEVAHSDHLTQQPTVSVCRYMAGIKCFHWVCLPLLNSFRGFSYPQSQVTYNCSTSFTLGCVCLYVCACAHTCTHVCERTPHT